MLRFLLLVPLLLSACAPVTKEPANLSDLKREVTDYAENGRYDSDLINSVSSAKTYLKKRTAKGGEKLTVVFDIDETVLSNLPHMKSADWGYQPKNWNAWVNEAKAPALNPVKEVYLTALSEGIHVIFLTGRTEAERAATVRNLSREGMGKYDRLVLRPDIGPRNTEKAVLFKTRVRENLTAEGHTIIASFGDQESDLEGGYTERTFKLPNPFYKIP